MNSLSQLTGKRPLPVTPPTPENKVEAAHTPQAKKVCFGLFESETSTLNSINPPTPSLENRAVAFIQMPSIQYPQLIPTYRTPMQLPPQVLPTDHALLLPPIVSAPEPEKSKESAEKVPTRKTCHRKLWARQVEDLLESGQWSKAAKIAQNMSTRIITDDSAKELCIQVLEHEARTALAAMQWDDAVKLAQQIKWHNPKHLIAQFIETEAIRNRHKNQSPREACAALTNTAEDAYNRGHFTVCLDAIEWANKDIESQDHASSPSHLELKIRLKVCKAKALLSLGNVNACLKVAEEALQLFPPYPSSHLISQLQLEIAACTQVAISTLSSQLTASATHNPEPDSLKSDSELDALIHQLLQKK